MTCLRTLAFAAFVVGAVAQGNPKNGNVAMVNDPGACAADLMEAVAAITAAANAIVKSTVTCPPKTAAGSGKDSACAAGIIGTFTDFSLATQKLASASTDCANTMSTKKGADCGADIASAIKGLGVSSGCLISSTESCKPPNEGGNAFGCVVDVVDVVDSLTGAAKNIANSVDSCTEAKTPDVKMNHLYQTWLATGCTALPSPDWIEWGRWFAEPSDVDVWQQMFEWCVSSKNGNFHSQHHAARMCCATDSGRCNDQNHNVNCNIVDKWTGKPNHMQLITRGVDYQHNWPKYLRTSPDHFQ